MEAVLDRRWGLDVHKKLSQKGDFPSAQACSFSFEIASKKSVVACVITPQGREIRTFRSMTHLPVHDQGVAGIG
jgi:hypothetical protein